MVTMAIAGALTAGFVDDSYDERLDHLETRVARLEAEVGIGVSTAVATDQVRPTVITSAGSSSSSSSSSSSNQQSSSSYSGSWSSAGDKDQSFEISGGGTYHLTAQASAPMSVSIETANGDPVPGFTLETGADGNITGSGELQPGNYVLHVEASSRWVVILTSIGS